MNTELPQIIWIVLVAASVTKSCMNHGKPRTGVDSGPASIIAAAIMAAILWWGGFFSSGAC